MKNDPLSLKNLLFGGGDSPSTEDQDKTSMADLRQEMKTELPSMKWSDASEEIDKKVDFILNHPIDKMLADVWSKYKELQKYSDPKAYPAGKTVLTSLAKHKIKATFKPSVVIQLIGVDAARLDLPINLQLELEGVILKIDGGRIMAVQAGALQGVGTAQFKFNILRPKLISKDIFKKIENKTKKFDFPASIGFGDGIPIKRAQQTI